MRFRANGSIDPDSEPKVTMPTSVAPIVNCDQRPMGAVVVEAEILPERDAADADHAKDRAKHQAGGQLAQCHPPPVAEADFAQRQRPDDERGRLRAGIAAGAHDQWNEQGQHDRLFQLALVALHRVGGQHLADKQRAQPAGALLDHRQKTHLHIGLVESFHAAETMHVLGRFRDHRVDDVVDGDDAEELAVVHDRDGEQIIFRDQLSNLFTIGQR